MSDDSTQQNGVELPRVDAVAGEPPLSSPAPAAPAGDAECYVEPRGADGYKAVSDAKAEAMEKGMTTPSTPQPLSDPLLQGGVKLPTPAGWWVLAVAAAMGAVFGFALQKGRVFEPQYIRGQLEMKKFMMLKMFLSAAATSLLVTSVLSLTELGRSRVAGSRKWAFSGYRGAAAAIVGGLVLGAGMALSGSCPGTGPVQIGSGIVQAIVTVVGGLLGALAFGEIEPRLLKPSGLLQAWSFPVPTFDSLLRTPFWVPGAGMVVAMVGAVVGLEYAFPWKGELPSGVDTSASFRAYAWPPWIAGILVGLLQVPGLLLVRDTIGSSRAYVTVVAQLGKLRFARRFSEWFNNPYFCGCACGVGNYQQLTHVVFSVGGAALASWLSDDLADVHGAGWASSLIGGFLTVFGGRLAGGCTSGQGISGNAVLGLISPLATASMFVGGIAMRGAVVMYSR